MKFKIGDRVIVRRVVQGDIEKWKWVIGFKGEISEVIKSKRDPYLVRLDNPKLGTEGGVFFGEEELEKLEKQMMIE